MNSGICLCKCLLLGYRCSRWSFGIFLGQTSELWRSTPIGRLSHCCCARPLHLPGFLLPSGADWSSGVVWLTKLVVLCLCSYGVLSRDWWTCQNAHTDMLYVQHCSRSCLYVHFQHVQLSVISVEFSCIFATDLTSAKIHQLLLLVFLPFLVCSELNY